MTIEFSQFVNGGVLTEGDIIVGLQGGKNAQFQFPSIIGMTWNLITNNIVMVAGNGYVVNNMGTLTLTVPSVIALGDEFEITMIGSGNFSVQCAAGQTIRIGNISTSSGGTFTSSSIGDSVRLLAYSSTQLQVLSGVTADFSTT